jgi:hypothetical protein
MNSLLSSASSFEPIKLEEEDVEKMDLDYMNDKKITFYKAKQAKHSFLKEDFENEAIYKVLVNSTPQN